MNLMPDNTIGFDLFYQDASTETYLCNGEVCGYNGDLYCSNCGFGKDDK